MRMYLSSRIYVFNTFLTILLISGLLANTASITLSEFTGGSYNSIQYSHNNYSSNPVVAEGSRSFKNDQPFIDVVVDPVPVTIQSVGIIRINFTFEEYNGYNMTIKSNLFQFISVQGEPINSSWSSIFLDLQVPAGGNVTWCYNYYVNSDLLLWLKQQGFYKFYLNSTFYGFDENSNNLEINIKVPVVLKLTVAVIVDKAIYSNLKDELQRYYDDINSIIQVDFIECNGNWSTPRSLRNHIKTLWQTHNITGVILVGYHPIPMWEFTRNQNDTEKCPIPIFYEDLDGSFADVDADSYYDRHYWGPNDGPEIWASFIMPPIRGQTIPSTHLDPTGSEVGGGLIGNYYEDNSLTNYNGSRTDPVIDFDWEDEPLFNNIYPDNFSIRWTGKLKVDNNETYTFYTEARGGVSVWIDDNIVINRAFDYTNYMYQNFGGKYLTKGWHDIKVEYYENGQGPDEYGMLRLSWSSTKLKIKTFEKYFDKTHQYYTGTLGQPDNALLFMDYCYGVKCRMKRPIKIRLLDPIYAEHTIVGGCQNNTNASEYVKLLETGYELISVWSHAGSQYHWIKPKDDPNGEGIAPFWKIRRQPAGLVTLIWGCHGGDIMAGGDFERALSNNLVANYAFNTDYGLAAAGCTRSYGTTFRETYYSLQNESYLGLGYFLFKDFSYNKTLRIQKTPDVGKDKWIDDEILMGDPFIELNHRPSDLELNIENDRKWINYTDVTLKIDCTNSNKARNQMSFRKPDGSWTAWETYKPSKFWQFTTGSGYKKVEVRMQNSYGHCFNNAYDVIGIDTEPPEIIYVEINDGAEVTKNRTIKIDLEVIDDLSGPHWVSFSLDGNTWSNNYEYSPIIYLDLKCESGLKTIYVKVLDGAGNHAKIQKKTIRLETLEIATNATVSGKAGENGWYIGPVNINLDFVKDSPIFKNILYRIDVGNWLNYSMPIKLNEGGQYIVEYYGVDIYGFKEDRTNNLSIKLDIRPPLDLNVLIENGKGSTTSTEVDVEISALDDLSGCWQMRLSEDSKNWGEWSNYSSQIFYSFDEEEIQGVRTLFVQIKDLAGNIIDIPVSDDIYIDNKHPKIVSVTPVDDACNVSILTNITVEFSEEIRSELVNDKNIYLIDSDRTFIHGTYHYWSDQFKLVFKPDRTLEYYTSYSLMIEPTLTDLAGNGLVKHEIFNFSTKGLVPGMVQDLDAKLGDDEIYITWKPPLDPGSGKILGYRIYRNVGAGTMDFIQDLSPKKLQYLDIQIETQYTYSYRVIAYNKIGNGAECDPVSVYVPAKESNTGFNNSDKEKEDTTDTTQVDNNNEVDNNETSNGPTDQNGEPSKGESYLLGWVISFILTIIIILVMFFIFIKCRNRARSDPTAAIEAYDQMTTDGTIQPMPPKQPMNTNQIPIISQQTKSSHELENSITDYERWRKAKGI